jgi:hypothetical protein
MTGESKTQWNPRLIQMPYTGANFASISDIEARWLFRTEEIKARTLGHTLRLGFATLDPANDLTTTSAGGIGLSVGLTFWLLAIALAIVYFTYLFRSFRGKVNLADEYGH